MVEASTVVIGVLTVLLVATLSVSYLMYVRLRQLQYEVEELKSQVEMTDDELDRLESSIKSIKEDSIAKETERRKR
jgi:septal ring factor EnvC (AmiA/AmiB activator)